MKKQDNVEKFITYLKSKLGIKYSKWQIVVDFFYYVIKKYLKIDIKRNLDIEPNKTVCFELVGQGLMAVGESIRPEVISATNLIDRKDIFDQIEILKVE